MRILEQHDWDRAADIVADAGMVIVSVPIHVTEQVIGKLPPLPKDCILVDLASVKNGPLQAMLAAHDGPVLGLHPMFGPDSGSLAKQVVVWCDGRKPEADVPIAKWSLEQMQYLLSLALVRSNHNTLISVFKYFCFIVVPRQSCNNRET